MQIIFCSGTKVFEEALNAIKFLYWLKKFGPVQNILGPVKGQGIRQFSMSKIIRIFLNLFFIEEYQFRGTFFVIDIFRKLQFLKHFVY